jgi:hypothetical protein
MVIIPSTICAIKAAIIYLLYYLKAYMQTFIFFPVPVCAITASGMPGGTLVSMNRFSNLCG